ncbi:CvfB family protein [Oceanirhabdus sp. W0125-5]|uniref:CvfB family protein n=1 Tax=Oceanirhabdus sp. W0125-5 TaxID=2999116 RepID=UPI0022F31096|nr:S1-like domain-containing RNA-binding protein [Oceanirhabdus sp. W0125-5]WBW94692.1 S1-like domain-containing RNA-binding protein [Oceanirhabdus sp. W0125-5]
MIKIGTYQDLEIKRIVEHGAYVGVQEHDEDDVFLPKKQIPKGADIGDVIEVFIYKDSKDRLIATTNEPYAQLGEVAYLEVVDNATIGAFVDWGLEKDLLVPFKQQYYKLRKGQSYLFAIYEDKSGRLCGTTSVYKYLSDESPYKTGDYVNGVVYKIKEDVGVFVAVDNKYRGLIPENELYRKVYPGDEIKARVIRRRYDGKLDLSMRRELEVQMGDDAKLILDRLEKNGGFLPLHDKSNPDEIKAEFNMSKNAFKRAIGSLYKAKKITIDSEGIRLV